MTKTHSHRPLRILYSHYLPDVNHPAARMVEAIGLELRARGNEVLVHRCIDEVYRTSGQAKARSGRRSVHERVRDTFWFARTLSRNRASWKRDCAAVESFRPDIILAREDAYRVSIVQVAKRYGIPLVTYADAPVAYETRLFHSDVHWHPPGLVEALERWWITNSLAVITPCHPAAEELRKLRADRPITVVHNGVSTERFRVLSPEEKSTIKRSLGLPEAKVLVGFQGSFRKFHGIELLREIMLGTVGRDDLHWVLIGDGPDRLQLESVCDQGVSATFLGRQPPDRMGNLVGLLDIAVSTHMFLDGAFYFCPLKILEYAACGCAIIASDQGDIPLLLDHGRAGVLLKSPDPADWIAQLNGLLDDPDRVRKLGEHAREWVSSNLTWCHTAAKVEQVLLGALSGTTDRINSPPRIKTRRDRAEWVRPDANPG